MPKPDDKKPDKPMPPTQNKAHNEQKKTKIKNALKAGGRSASQVNAKNYDDRFLTAQSVLELDGVTLIYLRQTGSVR